VRKNLGDYISAFEMFDELSMDALSKNLALTPPLGFHPFFVLFEVSGNDSDHMVKGLEEALASLMSEGVVVDGTFSSDLTTMSKLWALRERIPEALVLDGHCYMYDISLPLDNFYEIVTVMREKLKGSKALRVSGCGHLGDGNIHFSVTSRDYDEGLLSLIQPSMYEWVAHRKGSISAEHGLGILKRNYIHYSRSREAVDMMRRLKRLFDPHNILNPGKTLPD
jgi:FAD/FMN-containing dehydrogenase